MNDRALALTPVVRLVIGASVSPVKRFLTRMFGIFKSVFGVHGIDRVGNLLPGCPSLVVGARNFSAVVFGFRAR